MRNFLLGVITTLAVLAAAGGYVWYYAPERLPAEWRRANPQSPDYSPVVYRWRDRDGVVHVSDVPPMDRNYEAVRVDPKTNVVPPGTAGAGELPKGD